MKVSELIEHLKDMDQSLHVVIEVDDEYRRITEIDTVAVTYSAGAGPAWDFQAYCGDGPLVPNAVRIIV